MEYEKIWKKVLPENEKVIFEFSVGKRYRYFWMTIFLILAILFLKINLVSSFLLIFISLFYFGWYLKIAYAFAFTQKRVIAFEGWLSTRLTTIDYQKITDVSVKQNFFEKILTNSGSLIINTAGSGLPEIILYNVEDPYFLKKKLDEIRK